MLNFEYLVDPTVDAAVLQIEPESNYDSFITVFTKNGEAGIYSGHKEGKSGQLSALLFCLEKSRVYNDALNEISSREYGETVIEDAVALSAKMAEQEEEEENPAIVQPIDFHQEG